MHDVNFDLNCIHRRFLLDLRKSVLDHTSERTIGGSANEAGISFVGNSSVILFGELFSGVTLFK
jgi:hypothetical protein